MSVFCPILSFIAPYHMRKIKAYNYVSEALARFARSCIFKLHVYDFFFYVGRFGGLPPPPPIPKSWLRYCCQLSLTRRVAKWRWPIPSPPTRYTKSPPLMRTTLILLRSRELCVSRAIVLADTAHYTSRTLSLSIMECQDCHNSRISPHTYDKRHTRANYCLRLQKTYACLCMY